MPQLQQIAATYASQLFWLLLVFGLLYFGIAKTMLPKIGRVIESREAKIAGDLAEAQSAQTRASEAQAVQEATLSKARAEAQALVGQASAKVQEEVASRLAVLDSELSVRLSDADTRIEAAVATASADLDNVAAAAANEIVARLTGQSSAEGGAAAAKSEAVSEGA